MKRALIHGLAALAAWAIHPGAWANVRTDITVSDLRVHVSALKRGARPHVSFAGDVGTTATCDSSSQQPPTDEQRHVASGRPFGDASVATPTNRFAGGSASLSGDAFTGGAIIRTSAWASSAAAQAAADGTIGLVDDVATASFTLSPWTLMTITAKVLASASATGATPFEYADSGLLMAIGDAQGTGPQFAYVSLDALAFGAFGPFEDTETASVQLTYENTSDAPIDGVFSGYVSSLASTSAPAVPEPASAALWLAGLALLGARGGRHARRAQ